ncbi:MAG: NUDIX domain-containing protein [bacterium]|nr:NUDIX domain-containing protein [bacterium]
MTSRLRSAGILLYRGAPDDTEVLIAHPGGPFWSNRDNGAWTIPKGLIEPGESPQAAARREFIEEIGFDPGAEVTDLGTVILKGGKVINAWAIEGDFDPVDLVSETIEIEFPRGSGRKVRFPEIDRVIWVKPGLAREKLNPAQVDLVDRLLANRSLGP